jgi:tetratricopeptide (TPR) repeat protein
VDEAIACYKKAIELNPKFAWAHNNLGNALLDKGQVDEAVACLKKAIELNPKYAVAHYDLGVALRKQRKLEEAVAEYREAIALKPDYAMAHNNLGNLLREKGQLEEAITEFREAIRIKKDSAEAYCSLGNALAQKGEFQQAVEYLRRGHELGSRNPSWRHPSAQWLRDAERCVELDAKLLKVLKGELEPADAAERLALAQLCQLPCKKQYAAAVRFFQEAFDADPKLAEGLNTQHRYNAACAAALAGYGRGKDADQLDEPKRASLRHQALAWLRADLKKWTEILQQGSFLQRPAVLDTLRHWQKDTDFDDVRNEQALANLPETERRQWQQLWQEVEALLQSPKTPPP